ncbi:hypothetical protein BC629DRAFT_1039808 [Irpex lacteus]|nr:hypothetical protein BC629DRAFT_1039808 [Irpex lacteus]
MTWGTQAEHPFSSTLQTNYGPPSCGHSAAPCPSERQGYQRSQYITQDDTQQVYFAEDTVRSSFLQRMRGSQSSLTGALGNDMNASEGRATASEYRRQSAHSTAFIPMNNSPQFIYNSPHTSTSPHSIQNFPHEHQEYSSACGGSPDVGSETKYIKAESPASYSAHVHNHKVKPERKRTGSPSSSLTGALGDQESTHFGPTRFGPNANIQVSRLAHLTLPWSSSHS